jgi:DNA-binding NarL/FixJ family response regulator
MLYYLLHGYKWAKLSNLISILPAKAFIMSQSPLTEKQANQANLMTTRLIIIDDNFVMRSGLRSALELEPDMEVLAEGENGLDAVRLSQELVPDVILMDFRMPKLDGVGATRQIIATRPDARILITTWNEEPQTLVEAIIAGAKGYLVHGRFSLPELVSAVRAVREGGALITPSLAPVLLDLIKQQNSQTPPPAVSPVENLSEPSGRENEAESLLTRRERDILELVQHGKSNREIAETLIIEEKTVKNHINSIYSKLHLRNRYEAITLRTRRGH